MFGICIEPDPHCSVQKIPQSMKDNLTHLEIEKYTLMMKLYWIVVFYGLG